MTPIKAEMAPGDDDDLTESTGRAKPPRYWIDKIDPVQVLNGKAFTREICFAKDCIPRSTRKGMGLQVGECFRGRTM